MRCSSIVSTGRISVVRNTLVPSSVKCSIFDILMASITRLSSLVNSCSLWNVSNRETGTSEERKHVMCKIAKYLARRKLTWILKHFVGKKFISREVDIAEVKFNCGQNILQQSCASISTVAALTSGFHG